MWITFPKGSNNFAKGVNLIAPFPIIFMYFPLIYCLFKKFEVDFFFSTFSVGEKKQMIHNLWI